MKMKMIFSILLTLSITLAVTTVQADDCANVVHLKGTIDNNAVTIAHPYELPEDAYFKSHTMGIGQLTLTKGNKVVYLTCALSGEPTGTTNLEFPTYDHMIVCNDKSQSEVSFSTWTVGFSTNPTDILKNSEIQRYCTKDGLIYAAFEEITFVNGVKQSKGLFEGASNLDETLPITVVGCINVVNDGLEPQINMGIEGDLCLPNW